MLGTAALRQKLAEFGGVAAPLSPEEMRNRVGREIQRWQRVVELKKLERQ